VPFDVSIPINNFWDEFGQLEDQNLGIWVKRVGTRNIFDRADEWSLKRAASEQSQ